MAVVLFLLVMGLGCWFLVFSNSTRRRMPRLWWSKLVSRNSEEQRELTDAVILVSALIMAMVFTLFSVLALLAFFMN